MKKTTVQPEIMRVARYVRVSTDEQAESELGLKDQRYRTSAMATVKGWPEPIEYADEGISGAKGLDKRPGLAHLMEDIRAGSIDVVIILSLDRLGRDVRLVLNLVDELRTRGVSLVSCKENLDTTTAMGQFSITILAAVAELERGLISERTKGALDALVRDGKDRGGGVPYGYIRTEEGFEIDRDEAQIVREIFMLREWGWSLRRIAANLNQKERPTPRGGEVWHHSTINQILGNESAYRGQGSRGQAHIEWPRILSGKGKAA